MLKRLLGKLSLPSKTCAETRAIEEIGNPWEPMDLRRRRMIFTSVKLNDRTVSALVDSGTSRSIINASLARELGLVPLGKTSTTSFTRRVSGLSYRAQTIEAAGTIVHDLPIDSYGAADLDALSGQRIPLIVGRDVLRIIDVEVDFIGDRVRWLKKQQDTDFRADFTLPLQGERAAFPSIDLTLEGRQRVRALLDLGSDTPITVAADYAREHGLLYERIKSSAVSIGLEGVLTNIAFSLRTVQIGEIELHDVPVHAVENWKLAEPISLGWPLFHSFHMVLSLGRKSLQAAVDRHILASEIQRDRLGISGRREEKKLVISHVAQGSPAWQAGLRVNDAVVSVDGRSISRNYPIPGERLGFRPPGSSIVLELSSGRIIHLTLANYF